ncbi:MAG: DMT family transporter [Rhodobacteraceae bacterium]|nr:DMT family transporter [Paracoccaceae bacterium]
MGVLFAFMWSSAFSTARIIVLEVPPLTALTLRFAISGFLGIGAALLMGQSFKLSPRQWMGMILFGICQNGIYLGANFVSMQWIEASLAAIIASTLPIQVAFLSAIFFRENIGWVGIAGIVSGFIGVLVIMSTRWSFGFELVGIILCVIASLALCIATLTVKQALLSNNLLMVVGLQMVVGFVFTLIPALLFESLEPIKFSWELLGAFTYQIIGPGLFGTWLWFKLVNRIGPTKASSFHFLNPFLGIAVAAVLLSEAITFVDIVGVIIITTGIIAVQLSKNQAQGV